MSAICLGQQRGDEFRELGDLDQERVVAEDAFEFEVRHVPAGLDESLDDLLALARREQPVRVVRRDEEPGVRPTEGLLQRTVARREIEVVHRPRQVEIAVGVEPLDKSLALVVQIVFDLELSLFGEVVLQMITVLEVTAELALLFGRAFGQTPQYWLNLQAAYDLKTAEREIRGRLRALRPLVPA